MGVGEHPVSVGCYGEKSKIQTCDLKHSSNTNWKKQYRKKQRSRRLVYVHVLAAITVLMIAYLD